MSALESIRIRAVETPQDTAAARALLVQYFALLRGNTMVPIAIRNKDREPELNALATGTHAADAIFLAWSNAQAIGCIAVHTLPSRTHAAEIKRLYVVPHARGIGLARKLIQAASQWARDHGLRELMLDTLPQAMPEAVRLYQSLGFTLTDRYNENAGDAFAFYRCTLE